MLNNTTAHAAGEPRPSDSTQPCKPNGRTIRNFLEAVISPGAHHEVCTLPTRQSYTISGDDLDGAVTVVKALDRKGRGGVYFTLNPVRADLVGAASDRDVTGRTLILFDVDRCKAVEPKAMATEEEKEAATRLTVKVANWLLHQGWPKPLMIDSGNGGQLLYPTDLPNDEASTRLIEGLLKMAAAYFDVPDGPTIDTDVFNASRLAKIPGIRVRKGDPTDERPHRMSRIVLNWGTRCEVVTAELIRSTIEALEGLIETREERAAIQAEANGTPEPRQNVNGFRIPVTNGDPTDAYLRESIRRIAGVVAGAAPGGRHNVLRDEAVNLAGLVKGRGEPYVSEARAALLEADRLNGHAADDGPGDGEELVRSAFEEMNLTPRNLGHVGNPSNNGPAKTASALNTKAELNKEADRLLVNYQPKTFGAIVKAVGELVHLWLHWLVIGNLSMVYSKPKMGKTRIYIRLIKTLWFAEKWPDGADNPWPAGTKTIILPYDRNHQEIAAEMKRQGIPDEAAICPHDPRDETGVSLLNLTDPLMLRILERVLTGDKAIKLIVVDTLTYASDKSLSKPEDMKAILDGIMGLAARYAVAVLILIHENREGQALGRRICERARVLMKLQRYNEMDPTRLRFWVEESNFPERPALTVVHTDQGVDLVKDQGMTGNIPDRRDACARWLIEFLQAKGDVEIDYGTLITAAGDEGYAGTFSPVENRWSDRQLLNRAIKGINDRAKSLEDLHGYTVTRREELRFGRNKPIVWFKLVMADPDPATIPIGSPF